MDDTRFDAITKRLAGSTSRRATLRLLAGGILGAWLSQRGVALARAQRPDRDGDGLFDADAAFYGAVPDIFDTDGDGADDGEEVRFP